MAELALAGGPAGLQLVDLVLSNLARQYRPHGFIYDDIVAPQPVEFNHGKYPIFELAKFFNATGQAQVADDAGTPIVDAAYSTAPYACEDYRLRTRITRKERLQAHPALHLDVSKTTMLLGIMALEREQRLANKLRSEGNGGKFTAAAVKPGKKWDLGTEKEPAEIQKDLQKAGQKVYKQTGLRPNTLIITEEIALAISQDPTIQQLIRYLAGVDFVTSGNITGDSRLMSVAGGSAVLPKKLFGFDVLCADGVLVNTTPGGTTTNLNEVWGNTARLVYINKNAAWGIPTVAYSFKGKVTGDVTDQPAATISEQEPGGSGSWAVVDRWIEPDPPAENIRAWECVDENIVAPEAGIEIEEVLEHP